MDTKQPDLRFDHKKYKSKAIDYQMLDDLMKDCIAAGTSRWASIVMGLKIIVFGVYLIARKILIDQEFEIAKQEYQQDQINTNRDDINQDELD